MKTKLKRISIIIIAVGVVVVGTIFFVNQKIYQVKETLTQQYQSQISMVTSRNSDKINLLKNDVLNRLKQCESGDLKISDAPILLDTNNKISMGMFMFQRDTVIYYYAKLYNKKITRYQAVKIALSPQARVLASDIIFNVRGGIFNWDNCAKQQKLITEVTIIKRIQ